MQRTALNYHLPPELIAQHPAARRDQSRLMIVRKNSGRIEHCAFPDLIEELRAGDIMVVNNTRVVPARLHATRESSGGRIEIFLLEPRDDGEYVAMTRSGGRLLSGEWLNAGRDGLHLRAQLLEKRDDGTWLLRFEAGPATSIAESLDAIARMPLPPYITRADGSDPSDSEDRERYQTVFAREAGAVAAPTAGLHFTQEVLEQIEAKGVQRAEVTLHVGAGTFKPVKVDDLLDHPMHEERFELTPSAASAINDARRTGGRCLAVGTTSVRTLESCVSDQGLLAQRGVTDLLILPGYEFACIDLLLTNFHMPQSTLLALVMAYGGESLLREAYAEAVKERYRFLSYGDAMLITD